MPPAPLYSISVGRAKYVSHSILSNSLESFIFSNISISKSPLSILIKKAGGESVKSIIILIEFGKLFSNFLKILRTHNPEYITAGRPSYNGHILISHF
ncbi:hypothetical protein ES703_66556 [subsurface metagenome]